MTILWCIKFVRARFNFREIFNRKWRKYRQVCRKFTKKNAGKRLLIFWDGVRHHTGENRHNFLAKQNEELAKSEWKITCELFAPYAPEENSVEAIWFQLKSLLRRFYRFGKNFKIINLLFQLFAKYNLFNFPNLKIFDAFSQFL